MKIDTTMRKEFRIILGISLGIGVVAGLLYVFVNPTKRHKSESPSREATDSSRITGDVYRGGGESW